jgi:hypothetical protein
MTNKPNQLEQLFASKNNNMQQNIQNIQNIQNNLLRKNILKVRVKSLSKTTVITLVALIGAVVFSVSFAWLFV